MRFARDVTLRRFFSFSVLLALLALTASAVRYDMTKAELLEELGRPTSTMQAPSGREVLLYPKGVRIELEKGVVVSVKGIALTEGGAASAPVPAPEKEEPAPTPEALKAQAEEAAADEHAEKQFAEANAKARAEMEKTIERLENPTSGLAEATKAKPFSFLEFFVEAFVKWVLMLLALKLTCKYWNADVEWSGLMIAAGADTGVRVACGLLGQLIFGINTLLFADEAIAGIVLLFVLRKVSTNQSLQQAITITMTSKVFSVVVGSFLATVIMNALW